MKDFNRKGTSQNILEDIVNQNYIESSFDRLESLKKNHNQEMNTLKNLIEGFSNKIASNNEEILRDCKISIKSSVNFLKEKLFTLDDL